MKKSNIHGILLLDKPTGITSNKVLQRIKNIYHAKKAGHAGTLDPLATGLLPICFGNATKTIPYLINSPKTYNVTASLGEKSTTGDSEGKITRATDSTINITNDNLKLVIESFLGDSQQIPPMHSAIKVNGRPLYKLAHKGKSIDRKPRNITIYQIYLNSFSGNLINLTISCSKGTYIRTLIEDISLKLGTYGYVKELRRISIDVFNNSKMVSFEELLESDNNNLTDYLEPVDFGLMHLPSILIDDNDMIQFSNGQSFKYKRKCEGKPLAIRIYDADSNFLGLANQENNLIKPIKVFVNN